AGFDPNRRTVDWNRVTPTVYSATVEEGPVWLTELAHGIVYSYYLTKGQVHGGRLIAIDAATGTTRWDVILPHSETGIRPKEPEMTEGRVYVAHWGRLDIFDAKSGAVVGTIGP